MIVVAVAQSSDIATGVGSCVKKIPEPNDFVPSSAQGCHEKYEKTVSRLALAMPADNELRWVYNSSIENVCWCRILAAADGRIRKNRYKHRKTTRLFCF